MAFLIRGKSKKEAISTLIYESAIVSCKLSVYDRITYLSERYNIDYVYWDRNPGDRYTLYLTEKDRKPDARWMSYRDKCIRFKFHHILNEILYCLARFCHSIGFNQKLSSFWCLILKTDLYDEEFKRLVLNLNYEEYFDMIEAEWEESHLYNQ